MKFHSPGVLSFLLAMALAGGPAFGPHATGDDFADATNAEAGGDAGDTQETATTLPSTGTYEARFGDASDVDWFHLNVASDEAVCIESRVKGDDGVTGEAMLVAAIDRRFEARDSFGAGALADLSFLLPQGSAIFLRLAPGDGSAAGEYKFKLETFTREELAGEGAFGTDAGNTQATATYIPDGCISGSLDSEAGDSVDWFKFRGEEGEALVLSVRAGDDSVPVTLFDPAGNEVVTVSGHEVAKVQLNTTGHWYLRVGNDDASVDSTGTGIVIETTYEVSTTDDSPCRPNCALT